MEIEPTRGGFRKPISSKHFILDYLAQNGEAYIAEMHRAYKEQLKVLAEQSPRHRTVTRHGEVKVRPYHAPRYHSFEMQVQQLSRSGLIEFSGREQEADSPQFDQWANRPVRRFYRLKSTSQ